MKMPNLGKVFLVGAGPGDVQLLTLKAFDLIENAEVIVYDRLVSRQIIDIFPQNAIKINVGKNAGNHPVKQAEINRILVEYAMLGHDVIRLKGGDSFLFGRGGEELEQLIENNIDFEVVPGITSPLAAAAYAGIPVTHRDFCSSLHIITGHKKQDLPLELDYESLVKLNGTLIFMMSVANLDEIAFNLMQSGMSPSMPCAIVENGTRPNQRKFVGTLETIGEILHENNVISPSIIIVGKVCSLSNKFDWYKKLPLIGKKILVTRPYEKASVLAKKLQSLGADVTLNPAIKTVKVDFSLPDMGSFTVLVFTSAVGVTSFFEKLFEQKKDSRELFGKKVFAVGKETAKALQNYGITADFIPSVYSGEALVLEALQQNLITAKDKLLILNAEKSSEDMPQILIKNKINFEKLIVYKTVSETQFKLNPEDYEIITFTSASCVNSVACSCENKKLAGKTALCIGMQTAKEAQKYAMKTIVSDAATIESMVQKAIEIGE